MSEHKQEISIWLFIGLLVTAYGLMIAGIGIWEIFFPPERPVVLASYRANLWWGMLMLALGIYYIARFRPRAGAPEKR